MIMTLIEECLLPRLLFSPEDALYTAKLTELLHDIETPHLTTMFLYNEVWGSVG